MTDHVRPVSSRTKSFVIGLAVGLVVGGLGGAFIGGLTESGIPSIKNPPPRPAGTTGPRDERPAATGATEPPTPESAPEQPLPTAENPSSAPPPAPK